LFYLFLILVWDMSPTSWDSTFNAWPLFRKNQNSNPPF